MAKKYLTRKYKRALRRNFEKFRERSLTKPKGERNIPSILKKKFIPCMDRYFKRLAIIRWKQNMELL